MLSVAVRNDAVSDIVFPSSANDAPEIHMRFQDELEPILVFFVSEIVFVVSMTLALWPKLELNGGRVLRDEHGNVAAEVPIQLLSIASAQENAFRREHPAVFVQFGFSNGNVGLGRVKLKMSELLSTKLISLATEPEADLIFL